MSVDTTNTQSIQWLRNGGVLSDGPTLDGAIISGSNTGTLTITGRKETDSGPTASSPPGRALPRLQQPFTATVAASCCPADLNGDNSVDDADFRPRERVQHPRLRRPDHARRMPPTLTPTKSSMTPTLSSSFPRV